MHCPTGFLESGFCAFPYTLPPFWLGSLTSNPVPFLLGNPCLAPSGPGHAQPDPTPIRALLIPCQALPYRAPILALLLPCHSRPLLARLEGGNASPDALPQIEHCLSTMFSGIISLRRVTTGEVLPYSAQNPLLDSARTSEPDAPLRAAAQRIPAPFPKASKTRRRSPRLVCFGCANRTRNRYAAEAASGRRIRTAAKETGHLPALHSDLVLAYCDAVARREGRTGGLRSRATPCPALTGRACTPPSGTGRRLQPSSRCLAKELALSPAAIQTLRTDLRAAQPKVKADGRRRLADFLPAREGS